MRIGGSWILANAAKLNAELGRVAAQRDVRPWTIDAGALEKLDTTGALLLIRALRAEGGALEQHRIEGMSPANLELLQLVSARLDAPVAIAEIHPSFLLMLQRIGAFVATLWSDTRELLSFVGLILVTLLQVLTGKKKLRARATVFHMEQVGLDAVPIVALLSFLVGAVVAFLGATVLRDFGD